MARQYGPLDELAKIRKEMAFTMKQTGFHGDLPAFLHFLRTDPRFYAKTPQELLEKQLGRPMRTGRSGPKPKADLNSQEA